MSDGLTKLFAIFGIITLTGIIFLIGKLIGDGICELIDKKKWEYKYKHRFDKPPTAKWYCKDCKYHVDKGHCKNKCENVTWADRYTPDNGFCHEAKPREKEGEKDG